jgi:hypothetical protein
MLKKIGLTLASLLLAYNSVKFVALFFNLPQREFSLLAIVLAAVALNLMITGVFAFLGFAFPTSKILPSSYYKIRNPHTLNRIYNLLGVEYFKLFLLLTFYRKDDNKKYFNGTKSGIRLFDYHTKQSEFGHLMAFVVILFVAIIILFLGHSIAFMWTVVINMIFNLYPVILQRKHRVQIERILSRS